MFRLPRVPNRLRRSRSGLASGNVANLLWLAACIAVIVVEVVLAVRFWDDLQGKNESLSAALRNVGLFGAAPLAFVIAAWRGASAHRSADASQTSVLNERYQSAAEMVASDRLVTRLGGIYALGDLARNHPESYHVRCMSLLCAFLRSHPDSDHAADPIEESKSIDIPMPPPEDIRIAAEYVAYRHTEGRLRRRGEAGFRRAKRTSKRITRIEEAAGFAPDLTGARLQRLTLWHSKLAGSNLRESDLRETNFFGSDLSGSEFFMAKMKRAFLIGADVAHGKFYAADMTDVSAAHADLSNARLADELAGAQLKTADLYEAKFGACDLTNAELSGANLTGASFDPERSVSIDQAGGLVHLRVTQQQLDEAVADALRPPSFAEGTLDAETGDRLRWNGRSEPPEGYELRDGRYHRKKRKPPTTKENAKSQP